jgi:hypothetical protein
MSPITPGRLRGDLDADARRRRLESVAPVINFSALSAAPAGASLRLAVVRMERLLGDLDIGVSMVLMSIGMAWMFAAMRVVA